MQNTSRVILFIIVLMCLSGVSFSQSFNQNDIILNGNYGVPHLYKGIVKIAAGRQEFKSKFEGVLEVSDITGLNPIAIKGEYGFTKYFGLGLSAAFWTINVDVKDYYNAQNQNAGNFLKDSLDIYSFNISSKSYGIRPNIHLPLKSRSNDLYFGVGLVLQKTS